jgi:hypothetical protein
MRNQTRQARFKPAAAAVLLLLILSPSVHAQKTLPAATVHLKFVDIRGEELKEVTITSFRTNAEGSKNWASTFHDHSAANIPFGTYYLRAFKTGFYSTDRIVPVYLNDVWAVVQLNVGEENGPARYVLKGTILR